MSDAPVKMAWDDIEDPGAAPPRPENEPALDVDSSMHKVWRAAVWEYNNWLKKFRRYKLAQALKTLHKMKCTSPEDEATRAAVLSIGAITLEGDGAFRLFGL
jgi:hypothetical protein